MGGEGGINNLMSGLFIHLFISFKVISFNFLAPQAVKINWHPSIKKKQGHKREEVKGISKAKGLVHPADPSQLTSSSSHRLKSISVTPQKGQRLVTACRCLVVSRCQQINGGH